MTPERWQQIGRIFKGALEQKGDGRAAFLQEACGSDSELRRQVEALLSSDEQAGSFMQALPSRLTDLTEAPSTVGTVPRDTADSFLGRIVSNYRLEERLAAGGMGVLYRGTDLKLGRTVAVKVLSRQLALDETAKARFFREARAASSLDHPNIRSVYHIEDQDGELFIVMALYRGETLKQRLQRGPVNLPEALEVLRQVALGLEAAHRAGIIHRDIKPANLLRTDEGTVKILDFGLAKLTSDSQATTMTQTGEALGTILYMSPEQLRGQTVDARSDLWSFGVVAYELLAGITPFQADSSPVTAMRILSEEPPPLASLPGVPNWLAELVTQLLRKGRAERPQSASEILSRLDRHSLHDRMKQHGLQPETGLKSPERAPEIPVPVATPKPPLTWEQRHLALLRVCVKASGEASSASTTNALEAVVEKVQSFGGHLEDLGPGSMVAVFGREPTEDAAQRAAHAALAIQRMVEHARAERNRPWATTAAIHAGSFLVGEIGGRRNIDADAKHATLAVLEDVARRGFDNTIVVTAEAQKFLERRFELAPLGQTQSGAFIWRLLERANAGVASGAPLTPFIGRQSELRLVLHRLALAKEGRGQVLALVGDAGIGKSRLVLELRRAHESEGVPFLEGRCYSYTTSQPYVPWLEIIHQACGMSGTEDFASASRAVNAALERVGGNPGRDPVYLLHLLGFREASEQLVNFPPAVMKARTVEALRLLCFGTGKQPVILAIEDLHWVDQASEEFLKILIEQAPAVPAAIVVTYRPGYRPLWADRSYATQISLPPLSNSESRSMLEATLGRAAVPESVAQVILRRAEGNAFFLEEMARAVGPKLEAGSAIAIPDTIQSVLRARVDRLATDVRDLAQCAAVIGKEVQFALLRAVADESDDALRRGLDELQAVEFLYKTRGSPDLEYTFKHALTHEVAYASLPEDRRRELHRRILEALERLSPDPLVAEVERCAHHAVQGEIWDKAVAYLQQAGSKALLRSANAEAMGYFTRGLELAGKLPPAREHARQKMELLLALGQAHQAVKGFAASEAETAYRQARELGQQIGEAGDLFRALWGLWLVTNGRGRVEDMQRIAEELLALAERQDDPALLLEGHHPMWATKLWRGDLRAAKRHVEEGMALYNREQHRSHAILYGGHDPGVCCRMMSGLILWLLGYPTSAVEQTRASLALARELSHPYSLAMAYCFAGLVHQLRRDVNTTREIGSSLIAMSNEYGFRQWLAAGKIIDGWGLAEQGRGAAATAQIGAAIAEYRATGTELLVPYFFSALAAAHLKSGDAEAALSATMQGLEVAAETGQQTWTAELTRLQGESTLKCTPSDASKAEAVFHQATEIARRQAAGSLELRALNSLARLLATQGARDAAQNMLSNAYDRMTEGFDTADLRDAKLLLEELKWQ